MWYFQRFRQEGLCGGWLSSGQAKELLGGSVEACCGCSSWDQTGYLQVIWSLRQELVWMRGTGGRSVVARLFKVEWCANEWCGWSCEGGFHHERIRTIRFRMWCCREREWLLELSEVAGVELW